MTIKELIAELQKYPAEMKVAAETTEFNSHEYVEPIRRAVVTQIVKGRLVDNGQAQDIVIIEASDTVNGADISPCDDSRREISVGPDELDEIYLKDIPNDVEWIAYWYEIGNYEGNGQAIFKRGNSYGGEDLGHCSCYGPTEHGDWIADMTANEVRSLLTHDEVKERSPDDYDAARWVALKPAVEEQLRTGEV